MLKAIKNLFYKKKFNFNVNDSGGKEMKEGYSNEVLF